MIWNLALLLALTWLITSRDDGRDTTLLTAASIVAGWFVAGLAF